jgi:hypothetical protein
MSETKSHPYRTTDKIIFINAVIIIITIICIALQSVSWALAILSVFESYTVLRTPWTGDQPFPRNLSACRETNTQPFMPPVQFELTALDSSLRKHFMPGTGRPL